MGWAGGTEVMLTFINLLKANVPDDDKRKQVYLGAIEALEDADWDTMEECEDRDPMFDEALRELHPEWGESLSKADAMWDECEAWVKKNQVRCVESIYQRDDVQEALYNLAELVCAFVGYYEDEEDEDEDG